ncbi:MAG: pilus (MSHA type) biogenesis protein MshL [Gammaproteobacteria bacterium]|nr:pilus (MSHA type) biogenesis protein MshL [Gammaproteobacteria bacterium]
MKIIFVLFLFSLSACNSLPKNVGGQIKHTTQLIDEALEESVQMPETTLSEVPEDIMQELSDSLAEDVVSGVFSDEYLAEPTFDLSVSNASAKVFFMSLVKGSDENMLVHPSVKGEITLDLKNVTIAEVMDLVREVYGYEYKKNKSGYIVLPSTLVTKIFHVNYLNVTRDGNSNMTVSSGQQSGEGSSDTENATVKTAIKSDFWSGLKATLNAIISGASPNAVVTSSDTETAMPSSAQKGRSVIIDPQANIVVVRAYPAELRDVEQYLIRAETNLQRQVIIEAKIIEVTLNEGFQSGIDWAALATSGNATGLVGQFSLNNGSSSVIDSTGAVDTSALLSTSESSLSNLFTLGVGGDSFGAIIRLLSTQGDVQVLSSPRISTVNNQKAVIKVGSDEYFVTGVSTDTSDSNTGSSTSSSSAEIERFFSGIALDVTPQISEKDEVILHIHPSVSDVSTQTKNFTVNGQTQSLPLAFSNVRESDTIIKAKNSQVVVIGGLMQNNTIEVDSSVPILGSIPVLGALFSQVEKSITRSELVILLKPIVISDDGIWSDYIKSTNQRIRGLRQKPSEKEETKGE